MAMINMLFEMAGINFPAIFFICSTTVLADG